MLDGDKINGNSYRFGDVIIDRENFRVLKRGEEVTLTPRAFDVLRFLIENGGRVVEKQELFEKIWKESFVSDNALTKIIREIRLAIGDDASEPRYVETVPKRGYRFIAAATDKNEIEPFDKIPTGEKSPKAALPKPLKRKKPLLFGAVISGSIVLVLGFIVLFIILSEWRSEIAAATAPIDSVAVLPFENETQDPDLEYLSDQLPENIINSLAQMPNLRVLPRNTAFYYKNKQQDPHTIGRSLRVRAVLTGKIVRRDDILTVQIELIAADRKAQLWGGQYSRPVSDSARLQEEISRAVLAYLSSRSASPATTAASAGEKTDYSK